MSVRAVLLLGREVHGRANVGGRKAGGGGGLSGGRGRETKERLAVSVATPVRSEPSVRQSEKGGKGDVGAA